MSKLYNIYQVFELMRHIFLFKIPKQNEKPRSRIWGIIFYLVTAIYLTYSLIEMESIGDIVAEWSVIYFATAIYMRYHYAVSTFGIWNYHLFDYPKIVELLKSIQEFHDRLKSDLNINVDLAKHRIVLSVGVVVSMLLCTLPFFIELRTTLLYQQEFLWFYLTTGAFYYVFLSWNSLGSIFYACTLYIKASQISALTNINKRQFVLPKFERLYFKWFENFSELVNSFGGIALLNLATIFVSATLGGYLVLNPTSLYNVDMLLYADVVALSMLILLIEAGKKVCDDVSMAQ